MINTNNNFIQQADFTAEQLYIFKDITMKIEEMILNNGSSMFLLSGAAGTGKTYLLTSLIRYFSSSSFVTVTAPTHKALSVIEQEFFHQKTKNIVFKTLHSFLNIKLVQDYLSGKESYQVNKNARFSKTDILVIDESSMVGEELFKYIKDALVQQRAKAILFVGDPFQLLPINHDKNIVFTDIINGYKLTEIVRQAKDSYIINIATQIRNIIKTRQNTELVDFFFSNKDIGIEYFYNIEDFHNDFCKNTFWENENKVIASFTNKNVDKHNETLRSRYWVEQKKEKYSNFFVGERLILQESYITNKNDMLLNNQEIILSYAHKEFLEDIGIYIWNCKDRNQNQIFIVDPQDRIRYQKFLDDTVDKINLAPSLNRQQMWKDFFSFKHSFALVKPPYASTIHKLQGSTFETVYVDITDILSSKHLSYEDLYRLMYVAITRASLHLKICLPMTSKQELGLLKYNLQSIISNLYKK